MASPLPFRRLLSCAALQAACLLPLAAQTDAPPADTPPAPAAGTTDASIFDEDPELPNVARIPDRIEPVNRAIFRFNNTVYRFALRPFARGYAKVVPQKARSGINSFFHNLAYPRRFVGNVLEGDFNDAAVETGRFVVNTVTTLGFAKTADRIDSLQERPSDLGLAFRKWGFGHGTYLILPVIGPTSLRDGIGDGIAGAFLDPVEALDKWEHEAIANGIRISNQMPELMDAYDMLKEASIDPYVALRDAYAARRALRVLDGADTLPARPTEALTAPGSE